MVDGLPLTPHAGRAGSSNPLRQQASHTTEKLKRDGGSLFELRDTPLKTIAKIMGEQMGLQRLMSAQREIAKESAALKAKVKGKAQAG
jgi:hypothetical protein